MSSSLGYCNGSNVKEELENTDVVTVEDRCRRRGVEASFFLSRLIDSATPPALSIDGQNLTLTTTFADGSTQTSTITLP